MKTRIKLEKYRTNFIASSGIGTEFVDLGETFVRSPDRFIALKVEERREIEDYMDAFLSSFGSRQAPLPKSSPAPDNWGAYPSDAIGLVLLIVIILLLMG